MHMSKGNEAIRLMFRLGYRVDADGTPRNPKGRKLTGSLDSRGYLCLRTRATTDEGKRWSPKALVHRLAAYQLFGEAALSNLVRHLDDNRLNNAHTNLALGAYVDNAQDRHRNHGTAASPRVCAWKPCGNTFMALPSSPVRYCSTDCAHRSTMTPTKPDRETLAREVWRVPASKLAKQLGVSDTTIKDWCREYEIDKPPRGYWARARAKERAA